MFRKLILFTTLFLVTLSPLSARVYKEDIDPANASNPLLGPLAYIESPEGSGSGFFTDPKHVITARHVLEEFPKDLVGVFVYDSRGDRHHIAKIQVSRDADVAMLELEEPAEGIPYAEVDCRIPSRFETLLAAGHPLNLKNITSPVMVVGTMEDRDIDDVTSVVVAGATAPGMSGGPLFSQQGKVVAIVSNTPMFKRGADAPLEGAPFTNVVPTKAVPELCVAVKDPTEEVAPSEAEPPVEEPKAMDNPEIKEVPLPGEGQ